jgi:hypothetical protein
MLEKVQRVEQILLEQCETNSKNISKISRGTSNKKRQKLKPCYPGVLLSQYKACKDDCKFHVRSCNQLTKVLDCFGSSKYCRAQAQALIHEMQRKCIMLAIHIHDTKFPYVALEH